MFLSLVIPTRNRVRYLSGALESLTLQTYPRDMFEVIIVDNGSTDNTREIPASFADKIPHLRYVCEETPGLHAGRHRGMATAKADILVFGDDDIQASPTWLEGIAEAFCDEQVVLVGGKDLPRFQQEPPLWIKRMWEKGRDGARMLPYLSIMDLGDEVKAISPYYVFGCNFSIRKAVLIEAGGFHPDAMPPELLRYRGDGETHVARYLEGRGLKALYHPKASVHHLVPTERMTESYFVKRAFLQGISDSYADLRSRKKPLPLKNLYFKARHRLLLGMKFIRKARIQTGYVRGY
ncbi:MAG: glycosyltransferase [Desulfobacterota bacterium]|nr:glycosyltransferase [Thermodesulfobacteriota bacterium]